MRRLLGISLLEFKLFLRNPFNLFFALLFPASMLLLYGGIYGNEPTPFYGGHGTVDASMPAYICLVIAVAGLLSLPLTVAQYRERKILKRFKATPVHPAEILLSQVLACFVMAAIGMALLILLGKLLFGLHFFGHWPAAAVSFILVILGLFPVGLLIAGVIPNSKAATVVSFIVYFPMLYLSGAAVPRQLLPKGMAAAGGVLPLTHGVNLLGGVWLGGGLAAHASDILFLLATGAVCTAAAVRFFRWESS